jgi:hypothetical protein
MWKNVDKESNTSESFKQESNQKMKCSSIKKNELFKIIVIEP